MRSEANYKRARADAMNGFACDTFHFDRGGEVKAEFQKQLVENILLAAVGFQMLNGLLQCLGQIVAVRLPSLDIAGVELENAKAIVSCKHRILVFNLFTGTAEAFFGYFGNVPRLAKFVAKIGGDLLVFIVGVKGFRKLDKDAAAIAAISGVLRHNSVTSGTRTGEKIEDDVSTVRPNLYQGSD